MMTAGDRSEEAPDDLETYRDSIFQRLAQLQKKAIARRDERAVLGYAHYGRLTWLAKDRHGLRRVEIRVKNFKKKLTKAKKN
jgi:hypothetical protein